MNYLRKFTFSFPIILLSGFFLTSVAQIKPTTAMDRLNSLQKRKSADNNSLLNNIAFRNIGPTQMNGRVVDIEVNPTDPTEFYVAYASGGLWHTVNNGLSFAPLFEKEDAFSIGDIAVNWKTAKADSSRLIWIGTGEVNSSRSSYSGTGVYKSTDNGKKWQYMGLPESHHIGEIILHPTNEKIAWVAVLGHLYSSNKERGVYKTTDGGKSWVQCLAIDQNTGAVEMDINRQNPDELYACAWYRTRTAWDFTPAGKTSGIYKTTDGGNHWKLITDKGSGFPTGDGIGRIGVAVFQKNPQILYAVVDNNFTQPDTSIKKIDSSKYTVEVFNNISKEKFLALDNSTLDSFLIDNSFPEKYTAKKIKASIETNELEPSAVYDWLVAEDGFQNNGIIGCEIYRSDDAGQHWKKVNGKQIKVFSSYGYYFGKIYVSPSDENKVISFGTSIIVSNDGGKTFDAVDKDNTHGDWHTCWINPNKDSHWIAGNDGGCNITYDNGKKWYKATSVPAGQFYGIATDNAVPYHVYGGLQDNGTWVGSSQTANGNTDFSFAEKNGQPNPEEFEWKSIGGGDGMQVQVDTRDNKIAYSGFQFGFYSRKNTDSGKAIPIHPMHDVGEAKLRYNWQTPILLSKHNQDIFYFGSNKLHRSLNKAENMQTISEDLTKGKKPGKVPYGTITTISESPLKFGLLYVGTDDGNIQVSKDGGYNWTLANKGLPENLWVSNIAASNHKEGSVFATLNGYRFDNFTAWLYLSEDYGNTWKQLGTNLPMEPLNVVKEDPLIANILYVGSDNGLYTSFDMGKSFMNMDNQLPRVPIHDLVIQQRENELVVGSHGRSIYITRLDSVHKIYNHFIHPEQLKTSLTDVHTAQMKAVKATIDGPIAKPARRKRKLIIP